MSAGLNSNPRIAILGLYNSGSTALAGMLVRLGVNMGPPYWADSHPQSPSNYYEPYDLAWHLRNWWNEPELVERVVTARRVEFLKLWVRLQESVGFRAVGAKHPLLSLCVPDLISAWGERTRFIWSYRPLAESVSGLARRGWFRGQEERVQLRLWESLHEVESSTAHIIRIDWTHVTNDPVLAAEELATLADLHPSTEQIQAAAAFVRLPPRLARYPPTA